MKRLSAFFVLVVFFAVSFLTVVPIRTVAAETPSQGESYAVPSYRDLMQAFVLMQGLNINKNKIADEYAKLAYCALYKEKYHNDFQWNKIRAELITRVNRKHDYFRVQYQMEGTLYLGRFNFETQQFPFIRNSELKNVGSFIAIDNNSSLDAQPYRLCTEEKYSNIFPSYFLFEISQPFTLKGLKISRDEAKALLDKMASLGYTDRRLYIRFRYRARSVDKIFPLSRKRSTTKEAAVFHGELTSVDLFLDHDMTKFYKSIPLK